MNEMGQVRVAKDVRSGKDPKLKHSAHDDAYQAMVAVYFHRYASIWVMNSFLL
jgi:hypothetical protein